MKIAVYSICKNEEKFVRPFLESCKNADYICIADTGSSDNTVRKFKAIAMELGIYHRLIIQEVTILPWRFDMARNANLAMIPLDVDICVCLDLDEVLIGDWRDAIESAWTPKTTRMRYMYVWSWNVDGTPGVQYYGDKIHARNGYRWTMPVHEILTLDSRMGEEVQTYTHKEDFQIHHHPDPSKPRSQYLPLLELAVAENPTMDRQAHYYARELYFYGQHEKAIPEFKRHLALPTATWNAERAASYRYMGNSYWALKDYDRAFEAFNKACEEDPLAREPWVALAQAHRAFGNHKETIKACKKALSLTEAGKTYISDPAAWSDWPNTMLQEAEKAYRKQ